jgi:predicted RNA binding protein YcfA (HicA-like mRNA interferase family)
MVKKQKLLKKILNNPKNVSFNDMIKIVESFGFEPGRISGSHHIFSHPELSEIVNLQNVGGKAKSYQVKQFIALIEKYNLQMGD